MLRKEKQEFRVGRDKKVADLASTSLAWIFVCCLGLTQVQGLPSAPSQKGGRNR